LIKTHIDRFDQLASEAAIVYGFETAQPDIDNEAQEILANPEARTVALEFARLVQEKEILTPEIYREIVGQVKSTTKQKGRNLFHPIRAALTGRGSGPEMEKLIPLYEAGSRLNLPRKIMSCKQRISAVMAGNIQ
jgi:glutamyl-tRNA synthetase/nondiscriminating glutamyl-tRNA synthetase